MIYKKPGEAFVAGLDGAPTGLAGKLGVSIVRKKDEAVISARTVAGIVEFPVGSGHYDASLVSPGELGDYTIFWDDEATFTSDDLIVSSSPPAVIIEPAYDVSSNLGKVRLLIADVGGADGKSFIFTDKEIEAFISFNEDLRIAAATALRTIAANEAQVSKVIQFLELKTNGEAVADSLLKTADKLEEQADGDYDFEIAEIGADFFNRREQRIVNVLEGGEGEVI
jgi:hypothetical protein